MAESIVSRLPLDSFVTARGSARRVGELTAAQIRDLLRGGAVRFVVADIGSPLQWVELTARFEFWKLEAHPRIANESPVRHEDFPGEYCYFATHWDDGGEPIVLLSKSH